jgi:CHAD domain-containing protein
MLIYLDSEEYSTFKRKFNAFLKTPGIGNREQPKDTPAPNTVREITPVLIYQRLAWVDSYDPYIENASFEQLHALRIEFKKLRYTLEYFQEVLGPQAEFVINDLKKTQDHLGALTDAQVVTKRLEKFVRKQASKGSKKAKKKTLSLDGIEAYQQFQIEQRDILFSTFPETWADFRRPEFRQNLAQAVSAL